MKRRLRVSTNVGGFSARRLTETACSGAVFVLLDIRPAEDIPEFLRQGDNPRPDGAEYGREVASQDEAWNRSGRDHYELGVDLQREACGIGARAKGDILAKLAPQ